jgi:6-phosphogluconolactonase
MKYLFDPSVDALVELCADKTVEAIADAWRDLRRAQLVITGGRTGFASAKAIDSALFRLIRENESFEGSVVHIWFSDERFVPAGDPLRNDQSLIEAFSLTKSHCVFHIVEGEGELAAAASHYARELDLEVGSKAFDAVILSMGEDGHIASLFPDLLDAEEPRSAISVENSPKEPPRRVSLSLARLAHSHSIYIFCLGESKIEALKTVQSGPVGMLDKSSPSGEIFILTDLHHDL